MQESHICWEESFFKSSDMDKSSKKVVSTPHPSSLTNKQPGTGLTNNKELKLEKHVSFEEEEGQAKGKLDVCGEMTKLKTLKSAPQTPGT